jgi:hypothetical protein
VSLVVVNLVVVVDVGVGFDGDLDVAAHALTLTMTASSAISLRPTRALASTLADHVHVAVKPTNTNTSTKGQEAGRQSAGQLLRDQLDEADWCVVAAAVLRLDDARVPAALALFGAGEVARRHLLEQLGD